jgi:hypothetical protein
VTETGFLRPVLLVDLLARTSPLVEAMWAGADLRAPSEGVWWAGIDLAPVWLDIAREFTEDWTHQQQIRDAVGRPALTEAQFLDPLIDTFLRALPNTYHHVPAGLLGESVLITIDDHGRELTWPLRAEPAGWTLHRAQLFAHTARVRLPADTLWRSQPARSALPRRCAQHTLRPTATGTTALQHRVRCALKIGSSRTRHALVSAKDPHSRRPEPSGQSRRSSIPLWRGQARPAWIG